MRVIYPASIINPKNVDEHFEKEASACTSTPDLLRDGKFIPRGVIEGETFLYRGWILGDKEYSKLCRQVEEAGGKMFVTPEAYRESQFGENWLEKVGDLTPKTMVIPIDSSDEVFIQAVDDMACDAFVVKGSSKSVGVWEKMFAPNLQTVLNNVNFLREYAPEEEYVLLREFEEWTNRELRTWWVNGDLAYCHYHGRGLSLEGTMLPYCDAFFLKLMDVAQSFETPILTIDVVESVGGVWRIVEVGNGQVCEPRLRSFNEFFKVDETFKN